MFTAVRFGNVLESEGSVMQTFRRQLQQRRNLTVTDPDVTRYFMTIDEASQLVIQTAVPRLPGRPVRPRHGRARSGSTIWPRDSSTPSTLLSVST